MSILCWYEDFFEGFRPSSGSAGFEIKKDSFYNFCKKTADDMDNEYFFIIDEINRGNLCKIFGELFMLIKQLVPHSGRARTLAAFQEGKTVVKILFVCHGNICRSPMAEFVMKDLVCKAGLDDRIYIESAATSTEELGNPVYPPARAMLASHGISCKGKTARQITRADYDNFDYIIGMDSYNMTNMRRYWGVSKDDDKLTRLLDWTTRQGDVADPWYTGDFQQTWDDVVLGCTALLEHISRY